MVKQGYKQTEIGVIPEDWDVKHLNDFGDVISGGTPSTSVGEYWDGDIAWCTPSDITSTMGKYIYKTDRNITHQGLKNSAATILPPNSILLCTRATIGELKLSGVPMATNQGFKNLCPNATGNVDYLYYLLQTKKKDMVELAIGSTFLEISKKALCSIALQTPSLPEQECIAEALSAVDSMISSLEKLIAKKKSVKQGAMQELLTGKKRLPGFDGEWITKAISDIAIILDDHRIPVKESDREKMEGNIPYCGANGVLGYVNDYTIDDEIILIAEDGGYFDEYATRPIAYKMDGKCWVNNHAHIIKAKSCTNQEYLFYSLVHKDIRDFITSGTRSKLNKAELLKITITLPVDFIEQTAIVSILSDMDNEIEALEQKLAKTRQIKQGMMQQLLTGKIRLV